ncbi:hypothetical protein [Bacteroides graminisolvens]|uniref:hypothetical protein n=1 Tax=Bacteroides graminisolvens TaxID=477666 RepID=UPI0024093A05|nr:hypothetical protein [Bacteroides graminisolvens]
MNDKTTKLMTLSDRLGRLVNRLDELETVALNLRNSGHGSAANIQFGYGEGRVISAEIDKSLATKVVDEQILKIKDRIIAVTQDLERVAKS